MLYKKGQRLTFKDLTYVVERDMLDKDSKLSLEVTSREHMQVVRDYISPTRRSTNLNRDNKRKNNENFIHIFPEAQHYFKAPATNNREAVKLLRRD